MFVNTSTHTFLRPLFLKVSSSLSLSSLSFFFPLFPLPSDLPISTYFSPSTSLLFSLLYSFSFSPCLSDYQPTSLSPSFSHHVSQIINLRLSLPLFLILSFRLSTYVSLSLLLSPSLIPLSPCLFTYISPLLTLSHPPQFLFLSISPLSPPPPPPPPKHPTTPAGAGSFL